MDIPSPFFLPNPSHQGCNPSSTRVRNLHRNYFFPKEKEITLKNKKRNTNNNWIQEEEYSSESTSKSQRAD